GEGFRWIHAAARIRDGRNESRWAPALAAATRSRGAPGLDWLWQHGGAAARARVATPARIRGAHRDGHGSPRPAPPGLDGNIAAGCNGRSVRRRAGVRRRETV